MSLDVYLTMGGNETMPSFSIHHPETDRVMIREGGSIIEISRQEWDRSFPDREPVIVPVVWGETEEDTIVYDANITHNLNTMADKAGIYSHLWRPDELRITQAKELIQPLTDGLAQLNSDPERFRKFNPPNGWGSYEGLVEFTQKYLDACIEYPEAKVRASR